jgi:hypothetical protein
MLLEDKGTEDGDCRRLKTLKVTVQTTTLIGCYQMKLLQYAFITIRGGGCGVKSTKFLYHQLSRPQRATVPSS